MICMLVVLGGELPSAGDFGQGRFFLRVTLDSHPDKTSDPGILELPSSRLKSPRPQDEPRSKWMGRPFWAGAVQSGRFASFFGLRHRMKWYDTQFGAGELPTSFFNRRKNGN
jgi:hypothetical protein